MFSFTKLLIMVLQFWTIKSKYIETVTISDCESCRLLLTCRGLSAVIAILEVNFTPYNIEKQTELTTFWSKEDDYPLRPIHPRDVLNYRCSGMNHCSFELTHDCPDSKNWGPGNLTVKYACISERVITKYCNSVINLPSPNSSGISQGFIHNPGYPLYYSGKECQWKIKAPPSQKIQLSIIDLSLHSNPTDSDCSDYLEIQDDTQVVYTSCVQEHPPIVLTSFTEDFTIVLKSQNDFNPRRGFFIHYSALGCPMPELPEDGYLVYRNDTAAVFHCCVGFHFPDTGARRKVISCEGDRWNETLPLMNCERDILSNIPTKSVTYKEEMASDLIAPTLLILALFIVNGIVLFYIYTVKKRSAIEVKEEELGTLTLSTSTHSNR
ncbi:unnamed protein product [Brassicogethes aeneus]|uniref:CUB domain-containing protein n=1 Tax=Brassicogethes aeneus TaxID=1431903 RepID=A0A9P0FK67_BRAAE|nr:unnamed protein product [Brassicogethes aeneus]